MLKRISSQARRDIEKFMGAKVYMETWVKVKENWREQPELHPQSGVYGGVRGSSGAGSGREISRSGATHFCQQRQNYFLFAAGGPISFSSERNGGKNAAKNPWFLDFLPPRDAAFWFVRNVELTYFSERCRFYSEMRRCAVLLNWRCLARKKTPYGAFFMSPCKYLRIFAARSPVLPVSASGLQAPPQMPYTSPAKPTHPLSPQRVRDTLSCNPPY